MRLASLDTDFWQLESAERRHVASPESFWIPQRHDREHLRPGQAAKLLFEIESEEDGTPVVSVERMWVFVTEVHPDGYIGILDNQPNSVEPSPEFYLAMGVEVPFRAEHIIDIADPPPDYVAFQRREPPVRVWPTD